MARVLFKGNEVIAEAALRAGVEAFFGYPITPQNEVPEYLAREMPKRGGVFLQTESELAGINMVLGASAAGPMNTGNIIDALRAYAEGVAK